MKSELESLLGRVRTLLFPSQTTLKTLFFFKELCFVVGFSVEIGFYPVILAGLELPTA